MSVVSTTKQILSWSLLLGTAVMAFVIAVYLSNRGIGTSIVVASQSYGLLENWTLLLLSLSIGGCVYILRGLNGGKWSVSAAGIIAIIMIASLLFLFGQYALWGIGMISVVSIIFLRMRKRSEI